MRKILERNSDDVTRNVIDHTRPTAFYGCIAECVYRFRAEDGVGGGGGGVAAIASTKFYR